MKRYSKKLRKLGQTMTEYIIIVALIAIASIAVVTIFSNQIRALFGGAAEQLAGNEGVSAETPGDGAASNYEGDIADWSGGS